MEIIMDKWKLRCRLCAAYDYGNLSIFENEALVETIEEYFYVPIYHDDILPKVICSSCHQFINDLVKFHKRVMGVQEMFNEAFNKALQTNIEQEHEVVIDNIQQVEELQSLQAGIEPGMETDIISNAHCSTTLETVEIEISDENKVDSRSENVCTIIENVPTVEHNTAGENPIDFKVHTVCKKCGMPFETFFSYYDHIMNGHKGDLCEKWQCPICDVPIQSSSYLKRHIIENHALLEDIQLDMTCPYCKIKINSYLPYRNHIKRHHPQKVQLDVWKCPLCDGLFKNSHLLRYHLNKHIKLHLLGDCTNWPDNEIELSCRVCHEHFETFISYCDHINIQHAKCATSWNCPICFEDLPAAPNLKSHLIQNHMHSQTETLNESSEDIYIPFPYEK